MSKKAQSLSLNTIIIAALALVVLIVIVLFFMGATENLFGKQASIVSGGVEQSQLDIWKAQCKSFCTLNQEESFCKTVFKGKDTAGNEKKYGCNADKQSLSIIVNSNLNVDCPQITSCT